MIQIPTLDELYCAVEAHEWDNFVGGGSCPKGYEDCSRSVYECSRCGAQDYCTKGSRSWIECFVDCKQPVLNGFDE